MFAERGWIASNSTSTVAAKTAMALARAGQWDEAEKALADSYTADSVGVHLRDLYDLKCFRSRIDLARLALEDYGAGRFHACVPVTLALLDGMGQELTGAGFFRQSAQLKPTESFLEIGPGVAGLLRTMGPSRRTTSTQSISIPYRH